MEDLVEQVLTGRRKRTSAGFAISLGVAAGGHGAVLAILLLMQQQNPSQPTLEYVAVKAISLQALGRPQAVPPKPVTPKNPTPRSEAEPPSVQKTPSLPSTKPASQVARPVQDRPDAGKKPLTDQPEPPPDPAQADDAAPLGTAGSNQGNAQGTSAFGTHRLENIDPDFTYDYYLDRMLALIYDQWRKPTSQGNTHAVVRFTVLKSGEISRLELAEPSGSNAFDLAALRAVSNANPLPRLPASYRRSALEVTLIVRSE